MSEKSKKKKKAKKKAGARAKANASARAAAAAKEKSAAVKKASAKPAANKPAQTSGISKPAKNIPAAAAPAEKKSVFSGKRFEMIVFFVWLAVTITAAVFHEPWRDEAQTWLIARDDSLTEMLFETTHNEGHPPLWCLLLTPFAKLGAPYELTIKAMQILFTSLGVLLMLLFSPFPKPVKAVIPFCYMIVYQTAVISRPYSLALVAFMLMAMFFKERDEKPVRFVLSAALLCLSHIYGLILAGLICLLWVIKLTAEHYLDGKLRQLLKSRCVLPLIGLLVFALLIVYDIYPSDSYYAFAEVKIDLLDLLREYASFVVQAFYPDLFPFSVWAAMGITAAFLAGMIYLERNSGLKGEFIFPFVIFGFMFIYFIGVLHSIIVMFYYLVYFLWISYDEKLTERITGFVKSQRKLIRYGIAAVAVVVGAAYVKCGLTACWHDVIYTYDAGRDIAALIKDNGLENCVIDAQWIKDDIASASFEDDEETGEDTEYVPPDRAALFKESLEKGDISEFSPYGYDVTPYFQNKKNLCANINMDNRDKGYVTYKKRSAAEYKELIGKEKEIGKPDIIIGRLPEYEMIFGERFEDAGYGLVYRDFIYNVYMSGSTFEEYAFVYAKRELIESTPGLKELPPDHNSII